MSRTIPASSSLNRHDTSLRFALSIFNRAIFSTTDLCQYVVANTPPLQLSSNSLTRLYSLFLLLLLLLLTFCPITYYSRGREISQQQQFDPFESNLPQIGTIFLPFENRYSYLLVVRARINFIRSRSEQVSSNWEFLFLNSSFDNLDVFSSHFLQFYYVFSSREGKLSKGIIRKKRIESSLEFFAEFLFLIFLSPPLYLSLKTIKTRNTRFLSSGRKKLSKKSSHPRDIHQIHFVEDRKRGSPRIRQARQRQQGSWDIARGDR